MREIVLDTETTGFKPEEGHRLVEIGCLELVNHVQTGNRFHVYINPERPVPPEAAAVHGLTDEFLADKPVFETVAAEFVAFIGDSPLVIHNASFDMKFLRWELKLLGYPELKNNAIDTLMMARQKFPGAPATLDALCKRFGVDNSGRTFHGALLDAQLLAEVYLELLGGRQAGLSLTGAPVARRSQEAGGTGTRTRREPRPHAPTAEELEAHKTMLGQLKNALWLAE
ncbi:DNA polymerase-3 subunit epsilon [Azospirillum fermentarium]|uniref:DNA polymerase III subunit epsilon n=1 Tax=Azospirillum fermentarium TaxID=1233114 RepID=UPI002225FD40|nr:DNA polymerase III subunit epsilon [Azospirillum fermentarium]MCW2245075.1 DNA polymerase-3 subunit epsilon [Azospirillum fermentarium]